MERRLTTNTAATNSSGTRRSASPCEPDCRTSEARLDGCGICPTCVFSPDKSPASTRRPWRMSSGFQRRFVAGLILRCGDARALESVRAALSATPWALLAYGRSRRPARREDHPRRETHGESDGRPPAGVDMNEIWGWFDRSPDWTQSRYLCGLLLLCDPELWRMAANLTSVLLVRQERGFLQDNVSGCGTIQHDQNSDEDPEDPALTVVPGSSQSVSGVSRYRDFIEGLPVNLSKRILGMLDEPTLRRCQKVRQYWQRLAQETMEEIKFRSLFQSEMKAMMTTFRGAKMVSPTHAAFIGVPVPAKDDEKVETHPGVQKVKPFEAAYANVKTKTVQMEERNVYCGAYFTTVLLHKEDPHRAVDYRGGPLLAVGSRDGKVRLLRVASGATETAVMGGHLSSVRAVLLCQDRGLAVTGSCDASIRCWDLKTHACVMVLLGHLGTVNCLDVHADRLVSGGRDCLVKVWSLDTGKNLEHLKFKHLGPVRCARISASAVYSGCDRGLVKIWDTASASLLRVIDAHASALRCLFLDEWHLLSGDADGQVMAWSVDGDAKQCLATFRHPKEVKSLTLVYLRVITGCADGKLRIFNFLTGDCLRDITVEAETGRLLSLHVHGDSILVNAKSSVRRYQFAKVFWDYAEAAEGGQRAASDGSAASLGGRRLDPVGVETQAHDRSREEPERAELPRHTRFLSSSAERQAAERSAKPSVVQSERAASERMKRRGPHHPLTRDSILLKVNAAQGARRADEASVNAERNAALRDSWGPRTPPGPPHPGPPAPDRSRGAHACEARPGKGKARVPALKGAVRQSVTGPIRDGTRPRSADTHGAISAAAERPRAPECGLARSLPTPERSVKSSASLPRISTADPFGGRSGFRLLTVTQMEECGMLEPKVSKRDTEEKGVRKKAHVLK